MELYQRIVDLRDEIFALSEENLTLKERVRDLERQQEIDVQLVRDGNVYYRQLANGEREGPHCMACWDGDRKLVNVMLNDGHFGPTIRCGRCNNGKG
jgi:hypothetical protein